MDKMDMEEMMDKPMMASKLHKEHPLPDVRLKKVMMLLLYSCLLSKESV